MDVEDLLRLLRSALEEPAQRWKALRRFEEEVCDRRDPTSDHDIWEIFTDLTHDFAFYQPGPRTRGRSESYYGDERLEVILTEALRSIEATRAAPSLLPEEMR